MSAQQSAAKQAQANDAPPPADEPAAKEGLAARLKRALRARVNAVTAAIFNPCVALLQRFRRKKADGQDAEPEKQSPSAGKDQPHARDTTGPAAEAGNSAPRPRQRLRAALIYLGVLLAGGVGGAAVAYSLLGTLLYQQFEKSQRLTAENRKLARSAAEARKKLDATEAKYAAAEKKRERLEALLAAERSRNAPMLASNDGTARPLKTGDCALQKDNLANLKNCVEAFNR